MKKIFLKIWSILKNYYVIATLLFVVWVVFIDSANLISQNKQDKVIDSLVAIRDSKTEEIQKMKKLTVDLTTKKDAMERYGRENYQMKKSDEDVFLIVDPTKE